MVAAEEQRGPGGGRDDSSCSAAQPQEGSVQLLLL